jgi:hypothetical protein
MFDPSQVQAQLRDESPSEVDRASGLSLIEEARVSLRLCELRNEDLRAEIEQLAQCHRVELMQAQALIARLRIRTLLAERRAVDAEARIAELQKALLVEFALPERLSYNPTARVSSTSVLTQGSVIGPAFRAAAPPRRAPRP